MIKNKRIITEKCPDGITESAKWWIGKSRHILTAAADKNDGQRSQDPHTQGTQNRPQRDEENRGHIKSDPDMGQVVGVEAGRCANAEFGNIVTDGRVAGIWRQARHTSAGHVRN